MFHRRSLTLGGCLGPKNGPPSQNTTKGNTNRNRIGLGKAVPETMSLLRSVVLGYAEPESQGRLHAPGSHYQLCKRSGRQERAEWDVNEPRKASPILSKQIGDHATVRAHLLEQKRRQKYLSYNYGS